MQESLQWMEIRKFGTPIGAVGFLGDKVVAVIAYFDDADGNQDGRVSTGEWIASKLSPVSLDGRATVEVAMQARAEPDVLERDPSFYQAAGAMLTEFAHGLVLQGVYTVYFAPGVKAIGSAAAKSITHSMVKQFVVRKGFEAAVKSAFIAGAAR
jgi:hypothetical protein